MSEASCPLCATSGGVNIFQSNKFRVIRAQEPSFPAYYRVVWSEHLTEFSDLSLAERNTCMAAVYVVESVLRAHLQPTKINLASLGNSAAHVHWHVVARFDWDSHYPAPVWSPPQRTPGAEAMAALQARIPDLDLALQRELSAAFDQVITLF